MGTGRDEICTESYRNLFLPKKQMGVSKNRGTLKGMVKIMETPVKMDDLRVPLCLETPK